MPARFRIYDNGEQGDRYFLVDSKPLRYDGELWWDAISFNETPFHPSIGIGITTQLQAKDYYSSGSARRWGKRIAGNDLPPDANKLVKQFIRDCEGSDASMHTAMTLYAKDKPCTSS